MVANGMCFSGPGEITVEQINSSTGTVRYLHHDQQGLIRRFALGIGVGSRQPFVNMAKEAQARPCP